MSILYTFADTLLHSTRLHTLNIIGPGKVGRTLARLWRRASVFTIGDVLSRTPDSARGAVSFIGGGRAAGDMSDMAPAEAWMVTTSDDAIAVCGSALARSGALRPGDVVFHCSGALSSLELQAVAACGAHSASVHPVKAFADPGAATADFAGTWCAAEGDVNALALLEPAFERIGARIARVDAHSKILYHAGNVIASNYLVALVEAALRAYALAGIPRESARAMMKPLLRETADNALGMGTVSALTGPIARGDAALVARQLDALEKADPSLAALYRELGRIAVELARAQRKAHAAALDAIHEILTRDG